MNFTNIEVMDSAHKYYCKEKKFIVSDGNYFEASINVYQISTA